VYTFDDFLNFLEIIDLHESIAEQNRMKAEQALRDKQGRRK